MLALRPWRDRCVFAIAALLWTIPAWAQDPVDTDAETALVEVDPTADPADFDDPDSKRPEELPRKGLRQRGDEIEKILVTGEKQSTLQDIPTSSTTFTAGDLQSLRIQDIADLADYTPNLEINTAFAASNPTIFIRGIGLKDYNANAAGSVAVYQDGININSPAIQLGQLFDIDGIDVLRGPQGSVNGRNATAGAIMIRSAMPDGEFDISTRLTYGNYDDKEVEASINIPLIKDVLSMRVAGTAQWRDGYTKNQCAGWNPDKFVDPTTGDPIFRRADEASTRDLYEALQPAGQWTLDEDPGSPTFGEYVNGPVGTERQDGGGFEQRFVYLNHDLAIGTPGVPGAKIYASGVTVNTKANPFVLTEDLFDSNGVLVATSGTPVARQSNTLAIDELDGICVIHPPGRISTAHGEFFNTTARDAANWLEGNWRPENVQPGLEDFAGLERWTNNVDNWAARMVLLFEPLDNMEWMFNAHGTQNRGDSHHMQMLGATARFRALNFDETRENDFSENKAANIGVIKGIGDLGEGVRNVKGVIGAFGPGEGGGNPYSGFYSSDGIELIDAWGINGRGVWELDFAIITLLYDYEWYDRVVEDEGDANPSRIFPAIWSDTAWQTTEELRIEGEGERYTWTTGFFFLHEKLDANNFFPNVRQFTIDQDFKQTLTSWAPYASGEIDLVEEGVIPGIYALTLGAGLRYNQEKKEFSLGSSAVGAGSDNSVKLIPEETREATWKEWTGEAQLSYTPFSNAYGTLLTYLKYDHGFKGGHFNAGIKLLTGGDVAQEIDPVEPEFIDSIEFGIRSHWFDDRLTLNAAIFRYWYQDLQVFDISNEEGQLPIRKLLNGDADILGAEAELRIKPIPGLLVSANMGWLDSEFVDFVVGKARGRSGSVVEFDYSGNPLVAAPKWNFAVITQYEIPLFGWGSLVPQYDFNFRSKVYLDPQQTDPISQDAYWIHNTRIAYQTPDDRIELAFWVSNLFDEEYKVDAFDITREFNTILEVWGKPRMYGVTLSLNW